ncbi:hypothetical protein KC992_01065 [Candidatus Saccharibacteria bacterium]|nr:hypothetical protein [Candidatus Saccharibacteria bacterium]
MKRKEETRPPEEPTFEYVVVEDEFNILDEVFNEIFEQVEKEINEAI